MEAEAAIAIQLVYALPDAQEVIALEVPCGTTAAEAFDASGLAVRYGISLTSASLGIYGRRVAPDTILRSGDRLEVYRALVADPKTARRRRAERTGS
jgi:putative ubiquitin-RnfH superfamily antitoxin RatB of RatAB toxin-antitoxin module